jgi:hypothetical protein
MGMSGYRRRSSTTTKRSGSYNWKTKRTSSTNYKTITNQFKTKINSYQTLVKAVQGTSGKWRPSPSNLNTLAKWVDKGAVIQTVSNAQLKRWSKTNKTFTTPTSAKTVLTHKFGKTPIKAVYYGKGNNFIVATAPTWKGKNFKFPR